MPSLIEKIFPHCCVSCSSTGPLFCSNCQNNIDFLYFEPQLTPLEKYSINLKIVGLYNPPLSTAIKAYKYQGLYKIAPIFAELLYKHLIFDKNIDIITSVPLHPTKKRLRGFDQTKLIAKELTNKISKPYHQLLTKTKHTQNLASTNNQKFRSKLTNKNFKLKKENQHKIAGKHILLIDDVVTTGHTLSACLGQIFLAKPSQVTVMAIAHQG